MIVPEQGRSTRAILDELAELKQHDLRWKEGKVFAYTFYPGAEAEAVIKAAYTLYLEENGLDPTGFPSLLQLERAVVRFVADLLRGGPETVGNFTSGGTESIMLAVKTARDRARVLRPHIARPEVVFPRTAHCAFYKACHYLDVEPVVTDFAPSFRADVDAMADAVTENTILLMASAPSYAHGVVDPIAEIGQLALAKGLPLHVDACMGGIMLSFLRQMDGYAIPDFDFSVPGVTSISADMHKFGYAAKGASTVIYRDKQLRKHQIFAKTSSTTYALVNSTILSSKPGGPMAAAWAIAQHLGRAGYQRIFASVMTATAKLKDGINATGDLYVLGEPDMCLLAFASDTINVFQLGDRLAELGWYVQPQFSTPSSPHNLHLTVTLANVPEVDNFLADLNTALAAVKADPNPIDIETVRKQVRGMVEALGDDAVAQLRQMVGSEGGALPKEMALVSSILDALPKSLSEALLVEYFNDLFV